MPTFERTRRFDRDWRSLTDEQRAAFIAAVTKFVLDLRKGAIRSGLRVKKVQGTAGVFEMTWAPDGRATFQYGGQLKDGDPHVIWRRIGTHTIFTSP